MRPNAETADAPRLPRVDLYGPVHKGLRWALTTLLGRMGATDFAAGAKVPELLDDLDGVLYLCASHVEHEERHLHPAIERRCPGRTADLAAEHRTHDRDMAELRALAQALVTGPATSWPATGRALYLRFSRFVADTLDHMLEEELVVEPLLEQLYTQKELEALHHELLASIGPDEMLAFTRVMVPANGIDVRVAMLSGARAAMPAAAFVEVLRACRPALADDEWRELVARLDVAA